MKHNLLIIFLFLFCIIFVHINNAKAQSRFPEFSLGGTLSDIDQPDNEQELNYNIQTPLMNDILYLQEQVNLLEAMVERQSEIEKIADSYEDVGLTFKQPAPSEQTCQKLPVNLLCLYSYPDMEKNIQIVEDQKQRIQTKQQQALEEAIASFTQNNNAQNFDLGDVGANLDIVDIVFEPSLEETIEQTFFWSDVQCFLGKCTALIISSENDAERYRVSKGDVFGADISVMDINVNGVKVALNDKNFFLKPKSLSVKPVRRQVNNRPPNEIANLVNRQMGRTATPAPSNPNILEGLDATNQNNTNTPAIDNEVGSSSASPNTPLLGPTGLF